MGVFTEQEIRALARAEVGRELEQLRADVLDNTRAHAAANANAAKALERLSLIVVGDTELRVRGLLFDVDELKAARQATIIERAKLGGVWAGILMVAIVVGRVLWYVLDVFLNHSP